MKKYCIKIILLIGVFLSLISCKEEILEVYPIIEETFTVENLLDEEVVISGITGIIRDCQFSISLSPNETYTYYQDTMSGFVEEGKIPIYLALPIKFEGATIGAVEYKSEESFKTKWILKEDSHMVFYITSSLFQTEE